MLMTLTLFAGTRVLYMYCVYLDDSFDLLPPPPPPPPPLPPHVSFLGHQHSSVSRSLSKSRHNESRSRHSRHFCSSMFDIGWPQWVAFTARYFSLHTHLKNEPFHLQFELRAEHMPGMHSSPSFLPDEALIQQQKIKF